MQTSRGNQIIARISRAIVNFNSYVKDASVFRQFNQYVSWPYRISVVHIFLVSTQSELVVLEVDISARPPVYATFV